MSKLMMQFAAVTESGQVTTESEIEQVFEATTESGGDHSE